MQPYAIIIVLSWLAFVVYWFVSSLKAKKNRSASQAPMSMAFRVGVFVLAVICVEISNYYHIPYAAPGSLGPVANWLGAIFAAAGVAFAIWARANLGRNWGMPMSVKENPDLVTSGPYAFVRHPIYTGVLLALLGSALTGGSLWLFVFVIGVAYFAYSATQEEKLMLSEFPDAYPAYRARTKMLVPFIW